MANKQSNTSENSAASQSAKPGMFIPIPTAEVTNAAETARIRAEKEAEEARIRAEKEAEAARKKAEKEAKEKADKKAADVVIALIRAIGVVEYTDACLEKINAAKQAYDKLTADQKKLVDNADVITTSEKEYDKLKNAAEKEAKEKADKKAADVVIALIRAIGVVEYTDACLEKINAAKQAYTKLTADQRSHVKNEKVLTASEDKYNELAIAAADAEKARKRETARKKAEEAARKKAAEEARKKAEELSKKRKKHIVTIVWVICFIVGFCILVRMCSSDSLPEEGTEYIIKADDLQEDIIDLQLDDSKDLPTSNMSSSQSVKNDLKSKYDYVYSLSDGVCKVEKGDKKGFCDKNGKVLLPCEYDYIYNKADGVYKVEKGDKIGFVCAKTYKVLLPCEYDYIYNKADGVYKVEKGDKIGFVDAKTYKVLAPCEYDYVYSASNGLIKVEKGGKLGFLNVQNYKLVTPCIYDYIYSPSGGLIKVEVGSKTGYLNMDGSVAKQPV